jgi:hypothetical protein
MPGTSTIALWLRNGAIFLLFDMRFRQHHRAIERRAAYGLGSLLTFPYRPKPVIDHGTIRRTPPRHADAVADDQRRAFESFESALRARRRGDRAAEHSHLQRHAISRIPRQGARSGHALLLTVAVQVALSLSSVRHFFVITGSLPCLSALPRLSSRCRKGS